MNNNMDSRGREIFDEISNMENTFSGIKSIFDSEDPKVDYVEYLEKLEFLEDKLEVLSSVTIDSKVKEECQQLLNDIRKYKKEENIKEYEIKNRLIFKLMDLVNLDLTFKADIVETLKEASKLLEISYNDILSLKDSDKIFYSKLYMGLGEDTDIDELERFKMSKEIIKYLLDYLLEIQRKSNLPLDFYEKIMIINILDEVRLTLEPNISY